MPHSFRGIAPPDPLLQRYNTRVSPSPLDPLLILILLAMWIITTDALHVVLKYRGFNFVDIKSPMNATNFTSFT